MERWNKWNGISVEVLVEYKGCRCAWNIVEARRTNKINISTHTCTHAGTPREKTPNETIFILPSGMQQSEKRYDSFKLWTRRHSKTASISSPAGWQAFRQAIQPANVWLAKRHIHYLNIKRKSEREKERLLFVWFLFWQAFSHSHPRVLLSLLLSFFLWLCCLNVRSIYHPSSVSTAYDGWRST